MEGEEVMEHQNDIEEHFTLYRSEQKYCTHGMSSLILNQVIGHS